MWSQAAASDGLADATVTVDARVESLKGSDRSKKSLSPRSGQLGRRRRRSSLPSSGGFRFGGFTKTVAGLVTRGCARGLCRTAETVERHLVGTSRW